MFNAIKFFQAIGASFLVTVIVSFLLGFFQIGHFGFFLFLQTIITYGSMGFFASKWNSETPYTAAYLGAVIMSFISILLSHFVFHIYIFTDPNGIARSMSIAVLVSLLVAYICTLIRTKREEVLQ
ncbi:hypothetical protein [Lysinibacillus sp. SGAir0095]|uniref:hypothetical protein n=1 Tax=Lysinibacillus sp. SGAir0095 TaxID=2070463 RepID=UPI0010CCC394|nr:hypothetical protein [Lysinibacillus sp. SGAir0095]QCR31542.1 hypothetical protein C1N55_04875 [Lysinibacillus sp. SGAir0095]